MKAINQLIKQSANHHIQNVKSVADTMTDKKNQ